MGESTLSFVFVSEEGVLWDGEFFMLCWVLRC